MNQALAQVVSYVERSRAFMPPGTVAPFVVGTMPEVFRSGSWSSPVRHAT
jgi:hypothetical protein